MTTNSQTEQTAENVKKPAPRPVEVVKAEMMAETNPEKIVELSNELKRSAKAEKRNAAKAEKKAAKKIERAKNSASLKALKKLFTDLTLFVGSTLTVNVSNEQGEVIFAHTVTIPTPKAEKPEGEEVNQTA